MEGCIAALFPVYFCRERERRARDPCLSVNLDVSTYIHGMMRMTMIGEISRPPKFGMMFRIGRSTGSVIL